MNKSSIKTNWLHIYVEDEILSNSKSAANYINNLNNKSKSFQSHTTLSSFITIKLIFKTLKDWFILRKKGKIINFNNNIKKQINFLLPFFQHEWKDSIFGKNSLNNFYF